MIEVWFARYPNAEVVMQPLLFAALLANARAHLDDDAFFAPVAGVLLGLLLFLRFDAVLGIAGVVGGLALTALAGRRVRWSFFATLAASSVLAAAYMLGPMRAYAYLPIVFVSHLPWWQTAALLVVLIVALAALVAGAPGVRFSRMVRRSAPVIVAGAVCAAAVYALYVRQPGGKLTDYDAFALRTFTYLYLTLPALLAALFGYALLARQRLLARSRALPHGRDLLAVLLLQDPHRARAVLDGPAVPAGDSAGGPALRVCRGAFGHARRLPAGPPAARRAGGRVPGAAGGPVPRVRPGR